MRQPFTLKVEVAFAVVVGDILYHLSDVRHNVLEWYDFDPEANLLEIGAGCGAITGLLCDKVKRVVCNDLSKRRSTINATRNGHKGNLEIYVGNFEDLQLEEKFDYVTLIGVFEYSGYYISQGEPYTAMLERVKRFLKPGGKLIIAIVLQRITPLASSMAFRIMPA